MDEEQAKYRVETEKRFGEGIAKIVELTGELMALTARIDDHGERLAAVEREHGSGTTMILQAIHDARPNPVVRVAPNGNGAKKTAALATGSAGAGAVLLEIVQRLLQ